MTQYNQLTIAMFEIRNRKTLQSKIMYAKVTSKSGTAPTVYVINGSFAILKNPDLEKSVPLDLTFLYPLNF